MVLGCILLCTHSILKEVQLWDTLFENGGILMLILIIWILKTYNIHTYNDASNMRQMSYRALAALNSVGLSYPGLRQDRVWIQDGQVPVSQICEYDQERKWSRKLQVVLENGLLVKGSPSTPVDQTSLTKGLRVWTFHIYRVSHLTDAPQKSPTTSW